MPHETIEILAVWKERPGWFASGLMQWVADVIALDEHHRLAESPAFPLDDKFLAGYDKHVEPAFIRPDLQSMDNDTRTVVTTMHAEFVASLERDGWRRTGQGDDWFNIRFERSVSS